MAAEERFTEWLEGELEQRDMSLRELARQTQRRDDWGSHVSLSHMLDGTLPPSKEAMEKICAALQADPMKLPEYRMARLRHDLNPHRAGWTQALRTLRRLEK